jgi:MFS family permease
VSTRSRLLLGLIVAGWVSMMLAVWQTAPHHVDGPYTQTMARHIYAGFALFLIGMVAIPLAFWLVDRRQRGPRELRWRLILLLGVVLAFAIGAVGIRVAVHPPYQGRVCIRDTATGRNVCRASKIGMDRRDSTLDRYGLAALAVLLLIGLATARTIPRQAGATTIAVPQARPDH